MVYVPADCGSVIPGKSKAPAAFRDAGIVNKLRRSGIPTVTEHEALEQPARYSLGIFERGTVRNQEQNLTVCREVDRAVTQSLGNPRGKDVTSAPPPPFQLILGGECCMLPAVMSAFWRHHEARPGSRKVGLLYIDADTDLATPNEANSTGTFAGMNMAHLLRTPGSLAELHDFSRACGSPVCDASNTVFFGTNMSFPGNTPQHFTYLFDHGFQVVSSANLASNPEDCARRALGHFTEQGVDVIMVHLDVDAIDPRGFPLANLPNYTGVAYEEMMRAVAVVLGDSRVGGLTIAEVNPDHDVGLGMVERLTDEVVGMLARR